MARGHALVSGVNTASIAGALASTRPYRWASPCRSSCSPVGAWKPRAPPEIHGALAATYCRGMSSSVMDGYPLGLEAVARRALSTERDDRFTSLGEMCAALVAAFSGYASEEELAELLLHLETEPVTRSVAVERGARSFTSKRYPTLDSVEPAGGCRRAPPLCQGASLQPSVALTASVAASPGAPINTEPPKSVPRRAKPARSARPKGRTLDATRRYGI